MGTNNDESRRGSIWQEIMRNFSERHKEKCRASSFEPTGTKSITKKFKTKSRYEGEWGSLGMTGYGEYTFPNGVVYKGEFKEGAFHGIGELIYCTEPEEGYSVIRGKWENGVMVSRTLYFSETLEYDEFDWRYCTEPDRRFDIEYNSSIQPAGKSYLTAQQPTIEIPPGYYDTGDGLYHPETKVIYNYRDLSAIKRAPSVHEQKWIVENCRVAEIKPLGPRPDLYESYEQPTVVLTPAPPPPVTSFAYRKGSQFDMEHYSSKRDFYDPALLRSPSRKFIPSDPKSENI